jgi:hypothetical protein
MLGATDSGGREKIAVAPEWELRHAGEKNIMEKDNSEMFCKRGVKISM